MKRMSPRHAVRSFQKDAWARPRRSGLGFLLWGACFGGCFREPPLNVPPDAPGAGVLTGPAPPIADGMGPPARPSSVLFGVVREHLVPLLCFDAAAGQLRGGAACAVQVPAGAAVLLDDGTSAQLGSPVQLPCRDGTALSAWPQPPRLGVVRVSRKRLETPLVDARYALWPLDPAAAVQLATPAVSAVAPAPPAPPPPPAETADAKTADAKTAPEARKPVAPQPPPPLPDREQGYYMSHARRLHPEIVSTAFATPVAEQSWRVDLDGDGAKDQLTVVRVASRQHRAGVRPESVPPLLLGIFLTPGSDPIQLRPLRLFADGDAARRAGAAPVPLSVSLQGAVDLDGDHVQELWLQLAGSAGAELEPALVVGRVRASTLETLAEIRCPAPPAP